MEALDVGAARRLALHAAGLWRAVDETPHQVIERFGYLQLDTVSVAGARSHALVLHSRLDGFHPPAAEELLHPGTPLFEYWGHEVCWMPLWLYPVLAFRRRQFQVHPWWGDVLGSNPKVVKEIKRRLRSEGPLRTVDLEGTRESRSGWWNVKAASRVAMALWSAGELAIRQRKNFHRTWDLTENVIPDGWRMKKPPGLQAALKVLLEKALQTHGFATTGTLAQTWRLRNLQAEVKTALAALSDEKKVTACRMGRINGWIRPVDLETAAGLEQEKPDEKRSVLLSPFDPLLWDRARVKELFGFEHVLEIYKPAHQRVHGYYVLPVLCGEKLVARVDLKADGAELRVKACHFEKDNAASRKATQRALNRYAKVMGKRVKT
jgi:uncharacterized protein YcaQ